MAWRLSFFSQFGGNTVRRIVMLAAGFALAGTACQRNAPAEETATVRDSVGIAIVDNDGVDRPASWRLESIATIGGYRGPQRRPA